MCNFMRLYKCKNGRTSQKWPLIGCILLSLGARAIFRKIPMSFDAPGIYIYIYIYIYVLVLNLSRSSVYLPIYSFKIIHKLCSKMKQYQSVLNDQADYVSLLIYSCCLPRRIIRPHLFARF